MLHLAVEPVAHRLKGGIAVFRAAHELKSAPRNTCANSPQLRGKTFLHAEPLGAAVVPLVEQGIDLPANRASLLLLLF